MVTKTSVEVVDWALLYQNYTSNGPVQDKYEVVSATRGSFVNSVTLGGPVYDWKGKIRRLESATTDLVGGKRDYTESGELFSHVEFLHSGGIIKQGTTMRGSNGANIGSPTAPSISLTRANNQALQAFVSKANDAMRTVQGLVAFGELGEVLRGIRRPLQSLFKEQYRYLGKVDSNLRKSRRKWRNNYKKANEVVAGTWLESSFGWRPLVADIKGAAEALARAVTYTPPHKVVTGKGMDRQLDSSTKASFNGGFIKFTRSTENRQECMVRYRGCVKSLPPGFHGSLDLFGISLHEIVPTIWELIPYSFLVDYFTNAGNVIAGASFNSSRLAWVEKGYMLNHERIMVPISISPIHPGAGWKQTSFVAYPGGPSTCSWRQVNRANYDGSYIPSLEFTIPGLGLKWLNIAALAASSRRVSRGFTETQVP